MASLILKRPTKIELEASRKKKVADVIAPNLKVLFVGINPGLYTAAIGHHFGRPGNRFWPALHAGGFTAKIFSPYEERKLLKLKYGITNVVARTTATADELSQQEMKKGAKILTKKILKFRPRHVAILGISTYRTAFDQPKAQLGLQPDPIGPSSLWVLPNPSGLNAHYQLKDLGKLFRKVKGAADRGS